MTARRVVEFLEQGGVSPFSRWFKSLAPVAAAKVTTALYRLEQGNTSNVKAVGNGVAEYRVDFGPDSGSILGRMERSSYFWAAVPRKDKTPTFTVPKRDGSNSRQAKRGNRYADHPKIS